LPAKPLKEVDTVEVAKASGTSCGVAVTVRESLSNRSAPNGTSTETMAVALPPAGTSTTAGSTTAFHKPPERARSTVAGTPQVTVMVWSAESAWHPPPVEEVTAHGQG